MQAQSENEVQAYLDKFKIQATVEEAINAAVKANAGDPNDFMATWLSSKSEKGAAAGGDATAALTDGSHPDFSLVYFPVRAKAEPVRLALAYGGLAWADTPPAVHFGEGSYKEANFGQLPILVADGTMIAQTPTIMRYIAGYVVAGRKGFMGSRDGATAAEKALGGARTDAFFHAGEELGAVNPIVNVWKGEKFETLKAEFFSGFAAKLANIAKYLGNGPFVCGDAPSYGDFGVWHHLDSARTLDAACLDAQPKVVAFMAAVEALAGVKEYLAERPACVDIGTAPMLEPKPDPTESKKRKYSQ